MFNKKSLAAKQVLALLTFGVPIACATAYTEVDDLSPQTVQVETPESYPDVQVPVPTSKSYDFHANLLVDKVDDYHLGGLFLSGKPTSNGRLWLRGFGNYRKKEQTAVVGFGYRHLSTGIDMAQDTFKGVYYQHLGSPGSLAHHVGFEYASSNKQLTLDFHGAGAQQEDGDHRAQAGLSLKYSGYLSQKMMSLGRLNVGRVNPVASVAYTGLNSKFHHELIHAGRMGGGLRWEAPYLAAEAQLIFDTKVKVTGTWSVQLSLAKQNKTASYASDRIYEVPKPYYASYAGERIPEFDTARAQKNNESITDESINESVQAQQKYAVERMHELNAAPSDQRPEDLISELSTIREKDILRSLMNDPSGADLERDMRKLDASRQELKTEAASVEQPDNQGSASDVEGNSSQTPVVTGDNSAPAQASNETKVETPQSSDGDHEEKLVDADAPKPLAPAGQIAEGKAPFSETLKQQAKQEEDLE